MQVKLTQSVYDKLSELAEKLDMPRTQVINMLITIYNNENKDK